MQELWSQGREYERWPGTNINMVKIHTHVWHREVILPTFLSAEKKSRCVAVQEEASDKERGPQA